MSWEVVRAVRQISSGYPKNYLDSSSYRNQRCRWRCSHGVSAVCCMYRDERVIFVVNAACLLFCFLLGFFSHPSYVQTWGVFGFFVHAEVACRVRMKTERQSNCLGRYLAAATGEQANECLKQKQGEEGRKEGGRGWERGKTLSMHCGGRTGPEAYALVQLLLGLCKCIVSKFCYMFDFLTSLVHSTTLLFVPTCLPLTLSFPVSCWVLILSLYLSLPLPLYLSLLIGLWILL